MKRKYEKPNMDLEMFEANEYIAACWTLKCNVGGGAFENGGVAYREGNNKTGYQYYSNDISLHTGHGCKHSETMNSEPMYENVLWDEAPGASSLWGEVYEIFVWKGTDGGNHFTKRSTLQSGINHS